MLTGFFFVKKATQGNRCYLEIVFDISLPFVAYDTIVTNKNLLRNYQTIIYYFYFYLTNIFSNLVFDELKLKILVMKKEGTQGKRELTADELEQKKATIAELIGTQKHETTIVHLKISENEHAYFKQSCRQWKREKLTTSVGS